MDVKVGLYRKLSAKELMLLNCGVGEDSWESLGWQGDPTSLSWRKSVLNIHWKDWCWSWNSNTLATWCEELTHWKRPWCWERLKEGQGDGRGRDGWMASPTQWTWVWINSESWRWTGRPGVLRSMGSQRVGHDWETELDWTCILSVCARVCGVCIPALALQKCTSIFTKYIALCVSWEALLSTRNIWATRFTVASVSLNAWAVSHLHARFPSSVKCELGWANPKRAVSYRSSVATKPNFCCFVYWSDRLS